MDEVEAVLDSGPPDQVNEEMGDVLFSLVNVARLRGIDAEGCLRQAAGKFTRRFKEVEAQMRAVGQNVTDASAEDLDRAWEGVKTRERESGRGGGNEP
jgi:uncharacterized protein YabN with tetrapyrrole methylase and pyrophosphatase domain